MSDRPSIKGPLDGAPSLYSTAFDLAEVGYRSAEHLVSGIASSYRPDGPTGDDGRWSIQPDTTAPYATRAVSYRPIDPADANGTVIVEWLNVSGGLDAPAIWMPAHRELIRAGACWIGVSAQFVGIEGGGLMPGMGVRQSNPDRYGDLAHPGDAFAFDIFTQVASIADELLGPDIAVERLIATGASQSAFFLTTYANAIDPLTQLFHGYLLQGRGGIAAPLHGAVIRPDVTGDGPTNPLASADAPRLDGRVRTRDDVRVPVLVIQSETDVLGPLAYVGARQDDAEHFCLWEIAGASHADGYFLGAAALDSGAMAPDELAAAMTGDALSRAMGSTEPINPGPAMHYALQAAFAALDRWIRDGEHPAPADRLTVDSQGTGFALDAHGNALGGVRSPWVDVPVGRLSGLGQPGVLLAQLFGTYEQFDEAELERLYPGGAAEYLERFAAATDAAVAAGHLLPADADEVKALAPSFAPAG